MVVLEDLSVGQPEGLQQLLTASLNPLFFRSTLLIRIDVLAHPEQVGWVLLAIHGIAQVLDEVTFPCQGHRSRSNQPSALTRGAARPGPWLSATRFSCEDHARPAQGERWS